MFNYLLNQLMYTKAVVLVLTALLVLLWAVYFCTALAKRHGTFSLQQYGYYIGYTIGVFIWMLSNSYFHTDLIKQFSHEVAINMAILANLANLIAFACAYCFIAKLHKHYTGQSVPYWQQKLVFAIFISSVACNLLPGWTIKGIEITAPSNFRLEFGPYTKYFFLGIVTLILLTFTNLLSLKNSNSPIRRTRINYMILGITIFMCSTAIIQVGLTYFFNEFSLTWLPPTLSLSEMLFMGYGLLTSRFYSPKYICFVALNVGTTALIYASLISILYPFIEIRLTDVLLSVLLVGVTWQTLYKTIRRGASLLLYGDSICPVERISRLEEEFQHSPAQAIESLANYLQVPKDKLRLLDDYQGAHLYRAYFKDHSAALVIEEVEEVLSQLGNHTLSLVHQNMNKTQSALVLPIYKSKNNLSHVLVSSPKNDGVYFSYEELSALERVFKKVQVHINYEREVRQSQALASSIAHEMRNPFAQVQFQFEHLGSGIDSNRPLEELATHVNKGKQAIKRGHQLIDIIVREVDNASLDQEPVLPSSMSSVILAAVNQYGFDDDSMRQRVHLDIEQDFVVKINETLFNFVLFNLLRNAIYYFDPYPDSTITIRTLKGNDQNQVIFSDTGPGIPEAYLSKIFDDFFSHNKSGGSGLGLGYCQRVMKAFGGTICCESKEGDFTTFYLSFPPMPNTTNVKLNNGANESLELISSTPTIAISNQIKPSAKRMEKPLILVVDDKRVQLLLAKLYLEQLGYNVLLANNGKVAVQTIQNNPIDLVFMDIQMPIMDGFEAASIIKRSHPSLPIIALSGESGDKELKKINELMDGHLSKPTSKQALDEVLTTALAPAPV
ncbi:hybrid sensor histidine kinase/response regulator [Vibrio coralliilyticus]|nr:MULTISPECIES: response regulator [Vibrio]USD33517.1 response regulator [Vibrio sp. SCSIO 43186]USD46586.1 response regulator [Vibrio sp. SCSIO 43145]USD70641.1 response regulator [Vibrio sp. SCSIO 43139]USD95560.1 hybrid sensor histidine kinase/response regulator [Vibrio coralliilyticus]